MFAPQIVAITFPTLNHLLIRLLVFASLCVSHISIQTIDMSDLGETLITRGLEAKMMSLKMWLFFRIFSTLSADSLVLVWLERYEMLTILKYDFDCSNLVICKSTCLEITSLWWYHLQIIQAYLSQWPPCLQHIFMVVLQHSRYSVFHGRKYSYSTQSFMMKLPLSVSQHWNLCSG